MSLATEPRAALEPTGCLAPEAGPRAGAAGLHASPSAVLQLAACAGLATGNFELISMLVKCNLTDPRYYNVSRHYIWMYPLAGLMVCGEVADAAAALKAIPELKPDLVLVDISLGGTNGIDLIKRSSQILSH